MRYTELEKKTQKIKEISNISGQSKKHKLDEEENLTDTKRHCIQSSGETSSVNPQQELIQKLFVDMQKNIPQQCNSNPSGQIPEYVVFLSSNKSRLDYDFNLIIW